MVIFDSIYHTGVAHDENPPGRGSGRYGYGTGENPYQHELSFLSQYEKYKAKGISEANIAKMMLGPNAKTTQLRAELSIAKDTKRNANIDRALYLYDKYNGNVSQVGRAMGVNESTVRGWLDPAAKERASKYKSVAELIKKRVDEKGIVDIGKDSEYYMGITESTKKVAIAMLEKEGYIKSWVRMPQLGTNNKTTIMVLSKSDTNPQEIFNNNEHTISPIVDFSPDGGKTWWTPKYPESVKRDDIFVRYGDQGGSDKDGVIELKRGVESLSLGDAQYAQVRIAVDNKTFMKGMAIYGEDSDFPPGCNIIYNTNKKTGSPDSKVFKPLNTKEIQITDPAIMTPAELITYKKGKAVYRKGNEIDTNNPFGAAIKAGGQREYIGEDGKKHLSPINKLREEGDWDSWSKTVSAQFLAKQPLKLINQQLDLTVKSKKAQLDELKSLTNPVIRKQLLENFAGKCDSNAADLSAIGFKNQAFQVILPSTRCKEKEVFAPQYKDGDTVALIRYPHGGTFEIPILKVNNKLNGMPIDKSTKDAVVINPKVAERLSGADFDGDTVAVIPMTSNRIKIESTKPLKQLEGWDNKEGYKLPDDAPPVLNKTKQTEMGKVTNLITDMTVGGATPDKIVRAVKHSMVVIDAEKHHLDYRKSAKEQRIDDLKIEYQGVNAKGQPKGASTILSRANASTRIPERKEVTDTFKMTPEELKAWNAGKKVYRDTGSYYDTTTKTGKTKRVYRTDTVKGMDAVDNAMELVRNKHNEKEMAYAKYANDLMDLGNQARKAARGIKPTPVNPSARKTYEAEVKSLNRKYDILRQNNPRERQAQEIGNAMAATRIADNPGMDAEHKGRVRDQCLREARAMVGAGKERPNITPREWEAIQNNAISANKLSYLVRNMDQQQLIKLAMPKEKKITQAQINLAKSMKASGMYTNAEIAEKLGVSASYVSQMIK